MVHKKNKILVSVIVPTYNRLDFLKGCLKSLISQTLDKYCYEVIVVDDGSTDGTEIYVKSLQKEFRSVKSDSYNLQYYQQQNEGPAAARNFGAKYATGEILAFLDDDCIAHKSWLAEIVSAFDKYPIASYIGGFTILVYKKGFFKHVTNRERQLSKENHGRIERIAKRIDDLQHLVFTDNSAIRKSAFLKVKGFNTKLRYGEDCDLCLKLLETNHVVYHIYSMQVDHIQRDTIRSLFIRHYNLGRLSTTNYKDHYKGYTKIWMSSIMYHEYYNRYTRLNLINMPKMFFKSGLTICISRNFFKDVLVILLLSFFWPILALILFFIKILDRYIFETKTIITTLSYCVSDIIIESAWFIGNIVGSFKNRIIRI